LLDGKKRKEQRGEDTILMNTIRSAERSGHALFHSSVQLIAGPYTNLIMDICMYSASSNESVWFTASNTLEMSIRQQCTSGDHIVTEFLQSGCFNVTDDCLVLITDVKNIW